MMYSMKKLKKIELLIFLIALQSTLQTIDPTTYDDPTKADGPDMESPQNAMFNHSQNIFPNDNPAIRYFQANDGSLHNGIYNIMTRTAQTDLHNYGNVVMVNGTKIPPKIDTHGKYLDQEGNNLESIGIFNEYGENQGEPQLYFLFGKITEVKNNQVKTNIIQNNTQPLIDFYSYPADNDPYPGYADTQ